MVLAAQFMFWAGMLPLVSADAVTVSSLEGHLYALDDQEIRPVAAGDIYSYGKTLRTGPDTGAIVTLRDGSEVELAERTEFDVVGGWKGDSIRLNRGNIIIRASKQGSGRLRVLTGDCDVSVKGTIFSVRHGLKGSRVSVSRRRSLGAREVTATPYSMPDSSMLPGTAWGCARSKKRSSGAGIPPNTWKCWAWFPISTAPLIQL